MMTRCFDVTAPCLICLHALLAVEVAMMQFNEQKQDYINSLSNLEEDTAEYKQVLSECHLRGAERCVQVHISRRNMNVQLKI